jgi:hypothetical protein
MRATALHRLRAAARTTRRVGGLTHNFYRYPASFPPEFARTAIELFSRPGDTVVDPFMGGGTCAVEALASGRRFIGCDLNPLAVFVGVAKTTPMSPSDGDALRSWSSSVRSRLNVRKRPSGVDSWLEYQRNVPWWLRHALDFALTETARLNSKSQTRVARCSLLKAAQWALDCRRTLPSSQEFLAYHERQLCAMIDANLQLAEQLKSSFGSRQAHRARRIFQRPAARLHDDSRVPQEWMPPRLILTSPPYFGIHILYHRWQVQGRRETPAAYWIAGCRDGHGGSHYTFGDRKRKESTTYFKGLRESFRSVVSLMSQQTTLVQLLAFRDPARQLPQYLAVMREVGLREVGSDTSIRRRVWRKVPNRKWYAELMGQTSASSEVLLIHRKRR